MSKRHVLDSKEPAAYDGHLGSLTELFRRSLERSEQRFKKEKPVKLTPGSLVRIAVIAHPELGTKLNLSSGNVRVVGDVITVAGKKKI